LDPVTPVLVVAAVASGLFTGLLMAMTTVVQGMLNQLVFATYAKVMQGIIVEGRKSFVVKLLLLVPIACAPVALYFLYDRDDVRATTAWVMGGLGLFFAGPLLVSRYLNEPWYDKIMAWNAEGDTVADWQSERSVWFRLNLLRLSLSGMAFVAFLLAFGSYPR
jgi:uncharacterized membrane protein